MSPPFSPARFDHGALPGEDAPRRESDRIGEARVARALDAAVGWADEVGRAHPACGGGAILGPARRCGLRGRLLRRRCSGRGSPRAAGRIRGRRIGKPERAQGVDQARVHRQPWPRSPRRRRERSRSLQLPRSAVANQHRAVFEHRVRYRDHSRVANGEWPRAGPPERRPPPIKSSNSRIVLFMFPCEAGACLLQLPTGSSADPDIGIL